MSPKNYLDLQSIPDYLFISKKHLPAGAHHTNRVSNVDILLIVVSGTLCFEEDGLPVQVHEHEYYIQMSGKHQTGSIPTQEAEYFYINFSGRFTDNRFQSLPLRGKFDDEKITEYCETLKFEEEKRKMGLTHMGLFERQTIFLNIICQLNRRNSSLAEYLSVATQMSDYINRHFRENISLDDLTELVSYSKKHIIRIFKISYGITPYQYILMCRICYAKLLLTTTDVSVQGIVPLCGFGDIASFYYSFKKFVGMSPGDYRKSFENGQTE